jgi:hypothetical protein
MGIITPVLELLYHCHLIVFIIYPQSCDLWQHGIYNCTLNTCVITADILCWAAQFSKDVRLMAR